MTELEKKNEFLREWAKDIQNGTAKSKYTWAEALAESKKRLEEGAFLSDGANMWDIDNLSDYPEGVTGFVVEDENYYCVGWDGSIGITRDDGFNVDWIYKAEK